MKEYVNYHCHSDKSNFAITDSPVRPIDYINRIKELGHKSYVSTEHGLSYGWVEKYLLCEKHNIKFVYGVEGYIEHENKTYHTMFVAKSFDGMKSINRALNDAIKNNYKNNRPKLTIDMIKEHMITNEVICTTACVFGVLKDETLVLFKELYNIFKDNFYLEVLAHNTPMQIEFNNRAKELSKQYGIKLIGATDSHVIYSEQEIERNDLILAKRGNIYDDGDETGWYLDYPDYDTLVQRFMQQGIWSKDEVESLLDTTNMINNFGEIKLNKDFKIPTIYPNLTRKERCVKFISLINDRWEEYSKKIPKKEHEHYLSEIKSEMVEWFKCSMEDYALTTNAILNRAREMGGVITTTGRGCFVGDTNVWTTNGYKKIKDVQIGDIVINRFGQFDEVVNTLKYNIKEDLIKIKSIGHKDICLTKDHKVYVYDSLNEEFRYKKAQDIKVKTDYLTTPLCISQNTSTKTTTYEKDYYMKDKYILSKIECLEDIIDFQGFVYDLTIKNDPSFIVENVIVHNSCSSFLTNMLLGFTTVDRIKSKVPILQQRFMTADKIIKSHSTPDIDNNVADVDIFYKAQKELLGEDTNYPLIAFGTLQEKSAFKMLCKAKGNIPIELQNEMTDRINKYSKDKLYADDEDKDSIKLEDYLDNDELLNLYKQGEKYFGITTDTKRHASAFCISNDNIAELFGLCRTPSKDIVLNLEGKYMDELGYVKLDWLIVQVVDIIDLVYKKIGIPTPSAEELYNMVKDDEATWNIYKNGITCCVNQVEGSKTKTKAMKYQPKTIEELSALVAAIRPGFQSYYKKFENREHFEFGLKALDKLLQGEFLDSSWILYQESIMLLVQWLGFEKKDSADLMKAISKKKEEKIKMISGRFHEECMKEFVNNGFDENIAKEKTESIWKVILDASKYSFNASHSYCMALDSLYIAYAKAHHPEQTYIALIEYFSNKKKPDKVYKLRLEAGQFFGINIEPYKFRQDNRSVHIENKKVYQSLSSIKNINNEVGNIIYQLKDFKGSYLELYHKMLELGMSKDQREALIKIGYFDEFGSIGYLLWFEDNYIEYSTPRMDSIQKYYIKNQNNISLNYEDFILGLKNISVKCTEKTMKFENNLDFFKFVLQNSKIDDIILLEKIYNQIYYLGTLPNNITTCVVGKVIDVRNTGSILLVNAQTGEETWYGARDCINDLKKNNIIYIPQVITNEYKKKLPDGTYENRTSYKISSVINLTKMFNKKKGEQYV